MVAWQLLASNLSSETSYKEVEVNPPYTGEIYTAVFCGHCKIAKKKLQENGIPFKEEGIIFNGGNHKEMLRRTFGEDGAPRIFVNNWYIGTRSDLDSFAPATLKAIAENRPTKIVVKVPKQVDQSKP